MSQRTRYGCDGGLGYEGGEDGLRTSGCRTIRWWGRDGEAGEESGDEPSTHLGDFFVPTVAVGLVVVGH